MKRLFMAILLAAAASLAAAPAVYAAPDNPHQEEQDGCDHGATGKACRPDPQPTHGQDCEVHGNHGGINEDHCAPAQTVPTPTPTTPPTTETDGPTGKRAPPLAETGVSNVWLLVPLGLSALLIGLTLRKLTR